MQIEADFYEKLHAQNPEYGLSRYDVPGLLAAPSFRRWLERTGKAKVRLLEIGCGKGQFLLDLTEALRTRAQVQLARVAAVDLVQAPANVLDRVSPKPELFLQNVDGVKLPLADRSFDLVTCNHVLEHLFQTEHLLREIRRVLTEDGLAVVSVPNMAAWMNRVALLFAGQPLGSEVGTESISYGFWPRLLARRLDRFRPSGHIRDFTPRSLRDMAIHCGFKPAGWWAQNGGLFPTLTRNLGILLER